MEWLSRIEEENGVIRIGPPFYTRPLGLILTLLYMLNLFFMLIHWHPSPIGFGFLFFILFFPAAIFVLAPTSLLVDKTTQTIRWRDGWGRARENPWPDFEGLVLSTRRNHRGWTTHSVELYPHFRNNPLRVAPSSHKADAEKVLDLLVETTGLPVWSLEKAIETRSRQVSSAPSCQSRLLGCSGLAVCLLSLPFVLWTAAATWENFSRRSWSVTTAQVQKVEMVETSSLGQPEYILKLHLRHQVEGREYSVAVPVRIVPGASKGDARRASEAYSAGREITISYDPENPEDAVRGEVRLSWWLVGALGSGVLFLLGLGLIRKAM